MPFVSLILCIKNGMPHLPAAVASVCAQSYRDFELIVQDACSTDGSIEYLRSVQGLPSIDIISESDSGIGDAYNRAVQRCRGEIIGSIDADNLLEPDALARVIQQFANHPEAVALYGASHNITADGQRASTWTPLDFNLTGLLACDVVPPFGQSFFSRKVCGTELYFDKSMPTCADYDLWLRLSNQPIVRIEDIIGSVRRSDKSMTCQPARYEEFCRDKIAALDRYFTKLPPNEYRSIMRALSVAGIYAWAAESVVQLEGWSTRAELYRSAAIKHSPLSKAVHRLLQKSEPPPPAPTPPEPARGELTLSVSLAQSLGRPVPLSDDELAQAMQALSRLLDNDVHAAPNCTTIIPPAVPHLLLHYLKQARQTGDQPLANALEVAWRQMLNSPSQIAPTPVEASHQKPEANSSASRQSNVAPVPLREKLIINQRATLDANRLSTKNPNHHWVFDNYTPCRGEVPVDMHVCFMGTRSRAEFINWPPRTSPFVQTTFPSAADDYFEWVDLLQAIQDAGPTFTMLELGAGWGKWTSRAAAAARQRGIAKLRFGLAEVEPMHVSWLKAHLADNGISTSEYRVFEAALGGKAGEVVFAVSKPDGQADNNPKAWYGQAIIAGDLSSMPLIGDYHGQPLYEHQDGWKVIKAPLITLSEILANYDFVDHADLDIQGMEAEVIEEAIEALNKKVRRLHISTHGGEIEECLAKLLSEADWICLRYYPLKQESLTHFGRCQFNDGVQSWINPRLSPYKDIAPLTEVPDPINLSSSTQ